MRRLTFLPLLLLVAGCSPDSTSPSESLSMDQGVSLTLAQSRAARITDLVYDLAFTVESPADPVQGEVTLSFELASVEEDLLIDFARPDGNVQSVSASGRSVPLEIRGEHIVVPSQFLKAGGNDVAIRFTSDDQALNRNEEYLYTLHVPERARYTFPSFDQPDLKGQYNLRLTIPNDWTAVANGTEESVTEEGTSKVYSFRKTKPISTYLFAFAAGKFEVETAERNGRTMRLFHRETDADKVARNKEAIFDLHASSISWLEQYTKILYPFQKFDFVLIPSFQFGGMEHVGNIFYRDRSLFLDETPTQQQELGRASLIAHETAHMWFGDLVTMRWFSDVWMKEVFANFMAAKIVNPSFPEVNHDLRFALRHHPSAYAVDRSEGTHPVKQKLDNLNGAASLYGSIIYQKAPVVMKHLEGIMGEEDFRDGLREYLATFAYSNADWSQLIDIMDERSEVDLKSWSQQWVEGAGLPEITVTRQVDGDTFKGVRLEQRDPLGEGRNWIQRLTPVLGYPGDTRRLEADLSSSETELAVESGFPEPDYIVPNGSGIGYGTFLLDQQSQDFLLRGFETIEDDLVRAAAWMDLWEGMLAGNVRPDTLLSSALRGLPGEVSSLMTSRLLGNVRTIFWRYLTPTQRAAVADSVELALWQGMIDAETAGDKKSWFNSYRDVVTTPDGIASLKDIWSEELTLEGITLSEDDRTSIALGLALRGHEEARDVLNQQEAAITNADRKARFRFIRKAVDDDPAVRSALFKSFADLDNRTHEPWVLTALSLLNHPLRGEESEAYVSSGLALMEELSQTGTIFFPKRWADALLSGHQSGETVRGVRSFLDERPGYPMPLRNKILQAADPVFRASRILSGS